MTDFGLKCWDSQGNVTLDLTDTISRLRFTTIAGTNQNGSIVLTDIVGKQVIAFAQVLPLPPLSLQATRVPEGYSAHKVVVNGSKIIWTAAGMKHQPNATSNILVFIYT